MEKKYISANKYKRVSSNTGRKRNVNISKRLKDDENVVEIKRPLKKERRKTRKKGSKLTVFLVICVVLIALCVVRFVLKGSDEPFFNIFGVKVEETIEKLDIAVVDNVEVLDNNSNNIVFTELNNYTNGVLLRVTDKYEIEYELLESVEKQSNKEYILKIAKDNSLSANVLNSRLSLYSSESSKYYSNCNNIQEIEEVDSKTVKITLKKDDPLYIYNLQLPIMFSSSDTGIYNVNTTRGASNKITYMVKEGINSNIPKSISFTSLKNDDEAIAMFKAGTIDMFFTDSYDITEKLGKSEADIRSYVNGQCLFLLGNSSSKFFSKKEFRQAIAYSIDREKIRKEVYLNSGEIIDMPEIYAELKYKYDIYDAQNILLASGYDMENSRFLKDGEYVTLTLLVNKSDETKVKVATYIKEDLEKIGIGITIKLLTETEVERQISLGNYDLVLADVSLNENPNISFIQEYVNVSDVINEKIEEIENTEDILTAVQKVPELIQSMSDEVVCIGIHADVAYLVSTKGLNVFSDIKYMNIFTNLLLENN